MNIKNLLSTAFLLLVFSLSNGQSVLSATQFLATAQKENSVKLFDKKLTYQMRENHQLPLFEEVEFRTETNDFEWDRQEYVIRAQPTTPRQRKAQEAYHQTNRTLNETERQLALKEAMMQRYEWLVNWIEVGEELQAKEALKALYEDKLTVLKKTVGDLDFRIKDLVDAEEDIMKTDLDILKLKDRQARLNSQLTYFSSNTSGISFSKNQLITIPQMESIMNMEEVNYNKNLDFAKKIDRINLIDKEYEIEESKLKNPINYGQIKFGGNDFAFREYVSVGVGFRLPWNSEKDLELKELELDKIEEEAELEILKVDLVEQQRKLLERTAQLIAQQKYLKAQIEDSQAKYAFDRLLQIEGADPMDILDLKEILVKKEQAIQRIDLQILNVFVEWLAVSDKMMEMPLKNFLIKEQTLLGF